MNNPKQTGSQRFNQLGRIVRLDNIHRKRKAGYVQELYNRLKSTKLFIPPTEEEVDLFMKMETNTCLAAQAFKSIYTVNQQSS